jgi:hypothetical protein
MPMSDSPFIYDVFLCHNKAQKDWTLKLALQLEDKGIKCWLDEWHLRGGTIGTFGMEQGIKESRHVLLVLSPEFLLSEWTSYETEIALVISPSNRDRKVIPVMFSDCEVPERISRITYIDFRDTHADRSRYDYRFRQLVSDLHPSLFERPKDFISSHGQSDGKGREKDWEIITHHDLRPAIKHLREEFDTSVWKCSHITEPLCYAALHPHEKDDLEALIPYQQSFADYRIIIGRLAQRDFDRLISSGAPPSIFKAYIDVFSKGLEIEMFRLFSEVLQIALANPELLEMRPVEWAKTHLNLLLTANIHIVKNWIKRSCDKQDFTKMLNADIEEFGDFVRWKDWRAPKLIYMRPSGPNFPYDPETAWNREDETVTNRLLDGLSTRFIESLGFRLEDIAGLAEVEQAKKAKR